MLKRGHHGVQLTDEEYQKLYTWIDLNVPFWGTWTDFALNWANEFHRNWIGIRGPEMQLQRMNESRARREKWNALYQVSNMDATLEADRYDFAMAKKDLTKIAPEMPTLARREQPQTPALEGWPLKNVKQEYVQIGMPGGSLTFMRIPAGKFVMGDAKGYNDETPHVVEIKKPFLMADIEVPLRNFRQWKPNHYNGYVDELGKDHTTPGINIMDNEWWPAVRVSWQEAQEYCKWLSEKTGRKFRLPTEAEWEWAARGGTNTPFFWGDEDANFAPYANLADKALDKLPNQRQTLNYYLRDMRYDDGKMALSITGKSRANAFGLKDMIGNAAEWTQSAYAAYPYADDGRNTPSANAEVVARGGAWDLLQRFSRVSLRVHYPQWQRVANGGIRLVCEE
jgi:formylglycine-generating enzyme required for sulfatase activity